MTHQLIFKRQTSFFLFALFVVLFILYAFNYQNGDFDTYQKYYMVKYPNQWGTEVGYGFFMYAFREFGVPFKYFFIVQAFITLALLFRGVIKNTQTPFYVLIVFTVFYFPLDYVLSRNFLAFTILLQGLDLSNWSNGKENKKMLFFIFLSSLFHMSMLAYLLFFPLYRKKINFSKKNILLFLASLLTFGIIVYLIKDTGFFVARVLIYKGGLYSFLFDSVLLTTNVLLIFYASKHVSDESIKDKLRKINLSLLLILVLTSVIPIFIRVFRHVEFLNIIVLSNYLHLENSTHKKVILLIVCKLIFIFWYFICPYHELTLLSLRYNYLLDLVFSNSALTN